MPSELYSHWSLDPSVTFLNHGSFGACPREVQAAQSALRAELESEPVRFMLRQLEGRIDFIIDGGPCAVGISSTIVDCTAERPRILRAGAISAEAIEAAVAGAAR